MNIADQALVLSHLNELNKESINSFEPYDKQKIFIESTKDSPSSYMSACNGAGKTEVGCFIDACHITGEYPKDYKGYKLNKAVPIWIGSTSPDLLIEAVQTKLFCPGGYDAINDALEDSSKEWKGYIPRRKVISVSRENNTNYVKYAVIKNKFGGECHVRFFHYGLKAAKIAGAHPVGWVHCDEIPPIDIWNELLARQRTVGIKAIITATPELDADQEMIDRLFSDEWGNDGNSTMIVSIDDVPDHVISQESKEEAKRETSPAFAPAKLYGEPIGGGKLLSRVDPSDFRVSIQEFNKLSGLAVICGMDFGFNDAMAYVELFLNPLNGDCYLKRSTKQTEMNAAEFCNHLRSSGFDLSNPTAWPHDGMVRTKREDKKPFIASFREQGMNALSEHIAKPVKEINKIAHWWDIEQKAVEKKFFIVDGNHDFEQEWRKLRTNKDGKVVGEDHLMDALACAWQARHLSKSTYNQTHSAQKSDYAKIAEIAQRNGIKPELLL